MVNRIQRSHRTAPQPPKKMNGEILNPLRQCIAHNSAALKRVAHPKAKARLAAAIMRDTEAMEELSHFPDSAWAGWEKMHHGSANNAADRP